MAMPAPGPVHEEQTLPSAEKHFRNQLAAAVRSINWSYAIFWSISTSRPGLLTWNDGFYNGEIKTRKITNSTDLAADELLLQRSEQLRELYESLLSGECDHRARRPAAALSPEDLGDTEWYYMVCMTYAFRPGQGLPGKSFASSEYVWQCNAQFADSKTFPRALLAKSGAIQTIVCIPFMSGVLELGTTDPVLEDPDMVNRTTTSFWGLQFPRCSEEPGSSPSADDAGEAEIVFEDLDRSAIEAMISGEHEHELGGDDVECLSNGNLQLQQITKEIDEFYALCEELDVRSLDDNWLVDGSLEVPSSPETAAAGVGADDDDPALNGASRTSCFTAWKGSPDSDDVAAPVAGESQRLLKKAVAGGAWTSNGGGGTARAQEISIIKSHVMSERRRREKLNEMFLILKSLIPSVHKVDKASILAETIAYLKELERRVKELESSSELPWPTRPASGKVSGAKRKAPPEPTAAAAAGREEEERHWVLSKDGPSNVNVTIMGKEVLLEVQCRWKELLMAGVFDAIKSLSLDVLSVQASTPDGLLELKIRAQYTGSASVAAGMISEALQKAIGRR